MLNIEGLVEGVITGNRQFVLVDRGNEYATYEVNQEGDTIWGHYFQQDQEFAKEDLTVRSDFKGQVNGVDQKKLADLLDQMFKVSNRDILRVDNGTGIFEVSSNIEGYHIRNDYLYSENSNLRISLKMLDGVRFKVHDTFITLKFYLHQEVVGTITTFK